MLPITIAPLIHPISHHHPFSLLVLFVLLILLILLNHLPLYSPLYIFYYDG